MGAGIHRGRYTASMPDDFVVFLIGMRVNRPLQVHKWFPIFIAMPRMLRWLDRHPQVGLLKWHTSWIQGPAIVQYWRSFEDLARFARGPELVHLPVWANFNKVVRASGEVGIWHETYRVRAGEYECIYVNMPRIGLAAAAGHVPVGSTGQSAAKRIGEAEVDEPALAPYANPSVPL
jgi:fumigallin biosynthesis monooxygenase-like protein